MKLLKILFTSLFIVKIVNSNVIHQSKDSINNEILENFNIHDVVDEKPFGDHLRNKRFLSILAKEPNKNYQECVTPAGSKGHCKLLHHCPLSELKQNFLKVLDYLCIIEQSAIGICCPDERTEKAGPSIITLPERGDDLPVWRNDDDNSVQSDARPEDRGCGLSTKTFPKITGGRPADAKEWPWMAALILDGYPNIYCGGVLITDRHILTAAHCTARISKDEISVRLGEYDFRRNNETRSRDFRVIDIRVHEDYDSTLYENDLAVLKLNRPTIFTSYIWPICMPPYGETWVGYQAIVIGWGTQFYSGPNSDVLMEVNLPIWSPERCKQAFGQRVQDTHLCAGAYEGGRDSCQNDSGGPLMVQLPNKRWVIVGVVSWGINCGEVNHPGVYTRVNSFTDWIIENSVF